jgi:hypothetical protein
MEIILEREGQKTLSGQIKKQLKRRETEAFSIPL